MIQAFEPAALVDALIETEPETASRRGAIKVVRAPGRVNLIGEHTDYNEGFVLPAAIDLEIRMAYLPTSDRRVELTRLDSGERDGFDLDAARPRQGNWLDYVVADGLGPRRGRAAPDRPARRDRLDPATQRRPLVVGRHRARVVLGAPRRPRRAGRSVPARPHRPARRERLRRRPERADGPVRLVVRGRGGGPPSRLPLVRVASGAAPRRSGTGRLPHRLAAKPQHLGVQRPSLAVRGGRCRVRRAGTRRSGACET